MTQNSLINSYSCFTRLLMRVGKSLLWNASQSYLLPVTMLIRPFMLHVQHVFSVNQSTATSPLKQDFLGKYFLNDLEYIAQASRVAFNLLEKEGLQFALRGMNVLCYRIQRHSFKFRLWTILMPGFLTWRLLEPKRSCLLNKF